MILAPAGVRGAPYDWARHLDAGERLLWQGTPGGVVGLLRREIQWAVAGIGMLVLFGFGLVSFGWVQKITESFLDNGWFASLAIFGFLIAASFAFTGGRFLWSIFWQPHVRATTRYALTDRRAIIVERNFLKPSLISIPIRPGTRLKITDGRRTTIRFDAPPESDKRGGEGDGAAFHAIEGGDEVYRLIRRVQTGEPLGEGRQR